MAATILSFTQTITERDVHRAMLHAMLALATERGDASADATTETVLNQQVTTMAAAYSDLAAQLGICAPAAVEMALVGYPIV